MALAAGGFADDARVGPAEIPEMNGESDSSKASGGRGTAAFADGDFVFELKGEWHDGLSLSAENLTVGVEDQVILEDGAELGVASLGNDGEVG